MILSFTLNRKKIHLESEPNIRLVDLLRDKLNLTGTKEGCGVGECGACTVILNGVTINSCLVLAGQIDGCEIITIEGIAIGNDLHPLQTNFLKHGAVQCGFCTPGMVLSAYALLEENPSATEEEIKDAIAGNLCRCTGYKQIIDAVKKTAKDYK
jgi:carbon-monoxide dehydrogenase small subunit